MSHSSSLPVTFIVNVASVSSLNRTLQPYSPTFLMSPLTSTSSNLVLFLLRTSSSIALRSSALTCFGVTAPNSFPPSSPFAVLRATQMVPASATHMGEQRRKELAAM